MTQGHALPDGQFGLDGRQIQGVMSQKSPIGATNGAIHEQIDDCGRKLNKPLIFVS